MLQAIGLVKRYDQGDFCLGPIDLTLETGETIGILGHNGAGKSTFFHLITGNSYLSAGKLLLDGQPVSPDRTDLRKQIGYLPQNLNFPEWASSYDLLDYMIALHQISNRDAIIKDLCEKWDLHDYLHKPVKACSHGMQKRLGLAIASLHEPKLLILDEPFSGLDLKHIKALVSLIKERRQAKQMTILSTHIAPYAASLCQRLFMIQQGSITEKNNCQSGDLESRIQKIEQWFE